MRYVLKFRTTSESSDSLTHHGIKGMRWGRRRFQNEDGSLTPAGKKRYADDDSGGSETGIVPHTGKSSSDVGSWKGPRINDDILREAAAEGHRKAAEARPKVSAKTGSDNTETRKKSDTESHVPDEIRKAPKKDSESKSEPKKPDVVLDDDGYADVSGKGKKTHGKTKTEKEAEEAHERAEKRAKETEQNRKEEERDKKKNASEREKASKEKAREEAEQKRNANEREREAQRNLMEEAVKDRDQRREKNLHTTADLSKSVGKLSSDLGNAYDSVVKLKVPRMDLSKMTNKEMQERIQREALERQYDQMFNVDRQKAQAGKERVVNTLKTVGTVLTVSGAAIDVALKIKKAFGK